MRFYFAAFALIASAAAQDVRPKDVREIGKGGSSAIPQLTEFLKNPSTDVRVEAVKQLTAARALDALILATRDNEAEVQIHATDGLVNFYLPGYVQTGFGASIKRVGGSIKGKFTDTNDQVIDPYVTARPDVIAALGALVRGGGSMQARANAARALGILRGKGAVPDLLEALRTKDTDVLYESLIAMQKIRDESAGPKIAFLLRDLNSKVQIAAIETTGLLRNREAVPDLMEVLKRAKDAKVRRAALGSLAMLPDPKSRGTYQQYLNDKDEKMRAGAAEGFARLRDPADAGADRTGVEGRRQDVAADFAGLRHGDAGADGNQRIQPAAIPDQQSEFERLQRGSLAVPDGSGARQQHPPGALCAARNRRRRTRKSAWRASWRRVETKRAWPTWRS